MSESVSVQRGTLRRAVAVLDALAGAEPAPSVRAIAERTGLSKSAVQRLLAELDEVDLAVRNPVTRRYQVGPRALAFGVAYQQGIDVRQAALPRMRGLCERVQETVGLSVGLADQLIHVEQVEPERTLHARFQVGRPLPLWSGAPAKVLLAAREDEEIRRVLTTRAHTRIEPVNPLSDRAFLSEIERVRTDGHARAFEETLVGVNTMSVPVLGGYGDLVAVLSITAPAGRMDVEAMDRLLPELQRAAQAVSADLGPGRH